MSLAAGGAKASGPKRTVRESWRGDLLQRLTGAALRALRLRGHAYAQAPLRGALPAAHRHSYLITRL
jgi:hypothetical protein